MFNFFWSNSYDQQLQAIEDRLAKIEKLQQTLLKNQQILDQNNEHRTDKVLRLLNAVLLRLGPKDEIKLLYVGEDEMTKQVFDVVIVLPPPSAPDVATREVVITDGQTAATLTVAGDAVKLDPREYAKDEAIKVALTDIDGAGNRSPVRVKDFVIVDTFAPPQPGDIGLLVTAERFVDDEPVEPVVPPAVEPEVVEPPVAEVPEDQPVVDVPVVEEPVADVPVVDVPVAEPTVEPAAEVSSDEETNG